MDQTTPMSRSLKFFEASARALLQSGGEAILLTGPPGGGQVHTARSLMEGHAERVWIGGPATDRRAWRQALGVEEPDPAAIARAIASAGIKAIGVEVWGDEDALFLERVRRATIEVQIVGAGSARLGAPWEIMQARALPVESGAEHYWQRAARRPSDRDEQDATVRLVEALDGLALAISLAAERYAMLPPAKMLAALDRGAHFDVLRRSGEERGELERQIEACILSSGTAQRLAFRVLAEFDGPFSVKVAESALAAAGLSARQSYDALAALSQLGLLRADESFEGGGWFSALRCARVWSRSQGAAPSASLDAALEAILAEFEADLIVARGGGWRPARARLEAWRPTLYALYRSSPLETRARVVTALSSFWEMRGADPSYLSALEELLDDPTLSRASRVELEMHRARWLFRADKLASARLSFRYVSDHAADFSDASIAATSCAEANASLLLFGERDELVRARLEQTVAQAPLHVSALCGAYLAEACAIEGEVERAIALLDEGASTETLAPLECSSRAHLEYIRSHVWGILKRDEERADALWAASSFARQSAYTVLEALIEFSRLQDECEKDLSRLTLAAAERNLERFLSGGWDRYVSLQRFLIGVVCVELGTRAERARACFEGVYEQRSKGNNDPHLWLVLLYIGHLEHELGRFREAEIAYDASLHAHVPIYVGGPFSTARLSLSWIALERGDRDRAAHSAERALMTLEASSSKAEPELTALARLTLAYARGERGEEVDELIEPLRALRVGTPLASAAWVFAHALEAIRDDDPTREEALAEVASGNSVVARLAARAALHASSTPAPASPFYSLAEFSEASEASEASSPFEAELPVLLIDAEGAAFEFEGERVDLRRRRVLRLVLRALAESPEPIGVHELFEKGWPGVELHPEHAVQRVYWAIQELRKLGLRDVITTLDEGYTLSGARIEILI